MTGAGSRARSRSATTTLVPADLLEPTSVRFSELDGATLGVWGVGREIRSFADQLARRLPAARIAVVVVDEDGDGMLAPRS